VTSGNYDNTLDLTQASSFRAAFITANGNVAGAEALTTALSNGTSYFNIHTTAHPGGEIRGFLQPVPEPATMITTLRGARWNRRSRCAPPEVDIGVGAQRVYGQNSLLNQVRVPETWEAAFAQARE
jgi:hypothetical protein